MSLLALSASFEYPLRATLCRTVFALLLEGFTRFRSRGFMLKCCGRAQKSVAFMCDAPSGYLFQRIDFLICCKVCKCSVMQVSRLNVKNEFSYFRRTDEQAYELFDKLRTSIIYKIKEPYNYAPQKGSFFLMCNEYGRKTKCYSNLSSMLDVGESLALPEKKIILQRNAKTTEKQRRTA